MKILLVDDYRPLAEAMALGLRLAGHTVVWAPDGVAGLSQFRSQYFDVVLSDWNMPKMTGPEMIREILRLQPDAKIVMMSGDPWNKPPEGINLLVKGSLTTRDILSAFGELFDGHNAGKV